MAYHNTNAKVVDCVGWIVIQEQQLIKVNLGTLKNQCALKSEQSHAMTTLL
jgi:hypothetical protein